MNVPCYRGNASDVVDDYEVTFVQNLQTKLVQYFNPIGCINAKLKFAKRVKLRKFSHQF
jgi:hypothetical protein